MSAAGTIWILLPVHNRRAVTEAFVRCLARQTDRAFHLVLLDDGSTDGTADMVRASGLPATVLEGRGDWWWGGALHKGYEWPREFAPGREHDLVLVMNDDTAFEPGFLAAGRAALAARPRTLLRAQRLDGPGGALVDVGVRADWPGLRFPPTRDPAEVDCFGTRGLFIALAAFLALGGFRPRLLPHYLSDYEFTMRARRRGYRLASDPSVRLWLTEPTRGAPEAEAASASAFLRGRLATRSALNPLHWTAFILLACPAAWKLPGVARVWRDFLGQLRDAARRGRSR